MDLVGIPPGEFLLGSTKEERAWAVRNGCTEPLVKGEGEASRKTRIKDGFWLGRTEVTVGQRKQFVAATGYKMAAEKQGFANYAYDRQKKAMEANVKGAGWRNPGFEQQDNHPVGCVSWDDAVAFCGWLTDRERKAGRLPAGHAVRLPTEAEWEYACRASTTGKWWWGDEEKEGRGRLNWKGTEDGFEGTSPVDHYGARGRNGFGLADMLGNVWEWCLDDFVAAGAPEAPSKGGPSRVMRGGMFDNLHSITRCATRIPYNPAHAHSGIGFRVAVGVDVVGLAASAVSVPHPSSLVTPADDAFAREVAALPAEQQVARVLAKLKELNPACDPAAAQHKIENGVVTNLELPITEVSDVSPIAALTQIEELRLLGVPEKPSPLADLSPLRDLKLKSLAFANSRVADLSPLRAMPIKSLSCGSSPLSDLSPLKGMSIESLVCPGSQVSDLSPVRSLPLKVLWIPNTRVTGLEALRGMSLRRLTAN